MLRGGILRWIAAGSVLAIVAFIACWKISLALEQHACSAKSNAELLAMARRAARDTVAQMGAAAIDPMPAAASYSPARYRRAKFTFKTVERQPQIADVWISDNCHVGVGWLAIKPPLR